MFLYKTCNTDPTKLANFYNRSISSVNLINDALVLWENNTTTHLMPIVWTFYGKWHKLLFRGFGLSLSSFFSNKFCFMDISKHYACWPNFISCTNFNFSHLTRDGMSYSNLFPNYIDEGWERKIFMKMVIRFWIHEV